MVEPGLVVACGAAGGTLLGTAVAATALRRQDRRMARAAGLDSLWRLVALWDSPDMQRRRAFVARRLLTVPRMYDEHTAAVLNFFEFMGYLLRTGTLTDDDVWTNFSYWAVCYWFACEWDVKADRSGDDTVYEDYSNLVERLRQFEARRRRVPYADTVPSRSDWQNFLQRELRVSVLVDAEMEAESRRGAGS